MKKIGINGFGRIGRMLFRILYNKSEYEVVVINDVAQPRVLAHLLQYDSIHGQFSNHVTYTDNSILIDNKEIFILQKSSILDLSWKDFNVDIVFECTGQFKTRDENMLHIGSGAKNVILCCPPIKMEMPMIVLGVNHEILSEGHEIISNASCTTNCAAPMIKLLDDEFGLESAYVTTVHSYTSDQNLHDGVHVDLRRARSATNSIIPTTTGAAKALSHLFPHIELGGCGIRVPVSNCSLIDITCFVKQRTDVCKINNLFERYSKNQIHRILSYITDPIVSIDVKSSDFSCVFDSQLTYASGHMVKVVGWYDNEYGYCSRLVDLLSFF